MKLKQAGINISIMSELKSFPWQSNYEHDYLMDDYHLRVYQRIAPYRLCLEAILDSRDDSFHTVTACQSTGAVG